MEKGNKYEIKCKKMRRLMKLWHKKIIIMRPKVTNMTLKNQNYEKKKTKLSDNYDKSNRYEIKIQSSEKKVLIMRKKWNNEIRNVTDIKQNVIIMRSNVKKTMQKKMKLWYKKIMIMRHESQIWHKKSKHYEKKHKIMK